MHTLSLSRNGEADDYYDPKRVAELLVQFGFGTDRPQLQLQPAPSADRKLAMLQKAIHAFDRSTQINTGTFRLRLSIHANAFFDEVFPDLLSTRILQEVTKGPGKDRYRLGIPLGAIAQAIRDSGGSYDRFFDLIRSRGRGANTGGR